MVQVPKHRHLLVLQLRHDVFNVPMRHSVGTTEPSLAHNMHVVPFAGENYKLPLLVLCNPHLERPELVKQVLLAILAVQAFNLLDAANHKLSSFEHGIHLRCAMHGAAFTGATHSTYNAATYGRKSVEQSNWALHFQP